MMCYRLEISLFVIAWILCNCFSERQHSVTLENALSIAPFWRETTALVNSNFLNISRQSIDKR
uniref:Secreted protein n=1 Tax=Heterorhabditis bacteriophora TaxID=37862 RepID=A0A1I7WBT2_HETBA